MQHRVAVHARQADIQDQRVKALLFHAFQRGVAGVGHVRQKPAHLQEREQVAGNDVIVFNDQHPMIRTRRGTDCHH
ncbi:hypothetical protein D3C80_2117180 [compost metagenome]